MKSGIQALINVMGIAYLKKLMDKNGSIPDNGTTLLPPLGA